MFAGLSVWELLVLAAIALALAVAVRSRRGR